MKICTPHDPPARLACVEILFQLLSKPQSSQLRIRTEALPCRDLMAHLGFEGVLPPVEPVAETTADVDTLADSMKDVSITQPVAPPALPEADEDFFNEGTLQLILLYTLLFIAQLRRYLDLTYLSVPATKGYESEQILLKAGCHLPKLLHLMFKAAFLASNYSNLCCGNIRSY